MIAIRYEGIMTGIFQDLRYALRQLRNKPGFTLAAVIALGNLLESIFSNAEVMIGQIMLGHGLIKASQTGRGRRHSSG